MKSTLAAIRRRPQTAFWCIACGTFYGAAMLNDIGYWVLLIYGSCLGGALVTAVADGRIGLARYFGRIVRWRVGIRWYLVALLLPPGLNLAALALNFTCGAPLPANPQWPALADIAAMFIWPALLGIALAEEPGFRGFALPRLLAGHCALVAALIVGALHTLWHLPLLLQMMLEGDFTGIASAAVIIVSASVFFTWLFIRTGGSVLIAMLLHASEDLVAGEGSPLTLGPLQAGFSAADLARQEILAALVFAAAAILIAAAMRLPRLSEQARESPPGR